MLKTDKFIQLEITAALQLRAWLQQNHSQKESIWLVTYKKEAGEKYVSNDKVLDELLCFSLAVSSYLLPDVANACRSLI